VAALPPAVKEAWDNRKGPAILATIDVEGMPNIIYVSCLGRRGDDALVVADNYFDKTRSNIQAGSKGSFLFMGADGKPYQVKGSIEYHTDGPAFDDMKTWNPQNHPGNAAAVLKVEAVYSGAQKLA